MNTPKRMHTKRRRHLKRRSMLSLLAVIVVIFAISFFFYGRAKPITVDSPAKAVIQQAAPTVIAKEYGIATGSSLLSFDNQKLDEQLDGMKDLGITWIRFDFDWGNIQPDNATSYNWSNYDRVIKEIKKYNFEILGILDGAPAWARATGCTDSHCNPQDPAQFATFATTAAKRYTNIYAWEVWNEPNNPQFWSNDVDPAKYTELLKDTYVSLHRVNESSIVVTGGLSPQATSSTSRSPRDFLTQIYAAGAKDYFDAVADHPYTFPLSPTNTVDHAWNQMAQDSNSLRSIMVQNGDENKKIWITEFGSPTGGPGALATIANPNLDQKPYRVDEGLQAKILSDAINLYQSYSWVGPFMVYTYQDAGVTNDTNENFFGLVTYGGVKKEAYSTYKDAIANSK